MVKWTHPHTLKILDIICALAAKAELGGICLNAQMAINMQKSLTNLGHSQPPTPIHTDNKTENETTNNTMKEQKSNAIVKV